MCSWEARGLRNPDKYRYNCASGGPGGLGTQVNIDKSTLSDGKISVFHETVDTSTFLNHPIGPETLCLSTEVRFWATPKRREHGGCRQKYVSEPPQTAGNTVPVDKSAFLNHPEGPGTWCLSTKVRFSITQTGREHCACLQKYVSEPPQTAGNTVPVDRSAFLNHLKGPGTRGLSAKMR